MVQAGHNKRNGRLNDYNNHIVNRINELNNDKLVSVFLSNLMQFDGAKIFKPLKLSVDCVVCKWSGAIFKEPVTINLRLIGEKTIFLCQTNFS